MTLTQFIRPFNRKAHTPLPLTVEVWQLRVGDIVLLSSGEYMHATVYQELENGDVKVWRPYVHTGDVLYSGNRVIPYVGIEDFTLTATSTVTLLRYGDATK